MCNNTENAPRSKELLNKVFARLDAVDVNELSTPDLKDFLEVVQKCQFLEFFGKIPSYGFAGLNYCAAPAGENKNTETEREPV